MRLERTATFRLDATKVETLPWGGIRVPARIARTGIQEYDSPTGIRREYRPPDQVFNEDSLSTYRGAPVTVHHQGFVDASNWKIKAVGHVGDEIKQDGEWVASFIYLDDKAAIEAVKSRTYQELSAGYTTTLIEEPGEIDGQHYDAYQTEIRINHVAILPPGSARAGAGARMRLDSSMREKMDEPNQDFESKVAEAVKASTERIDALSGEVAALKAANAELQERLAKAESQERVDALVSARLDLVDKARKVLPDLKADGKSDREIMAEVLGEIAPQDASEDFLRGAFAAFVSQKQATKKTDSVAAAVAPTHAESKPSLADESFKKLMERRAGVKES